MIQNNKSKLKKKSGEGASKRARAQGVDAGASSGAGAVTLAALLAIALPTFGQLIAEPAFVLVDTAIVGHLGESALAGLALGSTVILTAVGLCIFLAYFTTAQVGRHLGAGRRKEGLQTGIDGMWLSLAIGITLAVVLFFGAKPICWLLGGREAGLEQAIIYTRMVVLGVPGMLLVYASTGLHRGFQRPNITLVAAVSGAVLNIVLDVFFVLVLGWGIAGSGFATCIAQWYMGIFLAVPVLLWSRKEGVNLLPHWRRIANARREGFPLFVRTLALRVGMVATVMTAAALGTQILAGYQVVNASWNFMANVLDSVAIAGQTLVAAELGAQRFAKARELTRLVLHAGLLVGCLAGIIFVGLGFVAPHLFSEEIQIQYVAAIGMIISGIALPMQGWTWAADGILIGAGDFRYLAWALSLASAVYIGVLAILDFAIGPFVTGVAWRTALLWTAFNFVFMGGRAVTNWLRIRTDRWMKLNKSNS